MRRRVSAAIGLAGLLAMFLAGGAWADPAAQLPDASGGGDGDRGLSFVVLPIPVSDPAVGNGLAAVAVGLFRASGSERPWATGIAGLYTDTRSWALGAFQKAYIDKDRFRVTAGAAVGDFHLDFFGIGQEAGNRNRSVPIDQKGGGALVEALMRISPHVYVGPEYRLIDLRTSIDLTELPFPDMAIPQVELKSRTSALGLAGEYDTRDSEFQARRGLYINGVWLHAAKGLGGDFNYDRVEAAANGYHAMGDKAVLAWRASVCWAGDAAPFYDICNFGSASDLRGYVSGQYRDHAMYAVQAEYRRQLFWRLGAVVFAGVGEVAESFDRLSTDNLLPAAGVGLRFQASKKYNVNAGVDYAVGKDSSAFYFRIGEAF